MVLSFILIQNRQGKTRLAKYYNAYSDDEKIKLKGEVRVHPTISSLRPPPFSLLYLRVLYPPITSPGCYRLSLFCITNPYSPRFTASSPLAIRNTNPTLSSSATTRSSIGATRASSSVRAWTPTITNWRTWKRFTSSWRCWTVSLGMCVNWIWCLTSTRYV